jgi:hypothetical protein
VPSKLVSASQMEQRSLVPGIPSLPSLSLYPQSCDKVDTVSWVSMMETRKSYRYTRRLIEDEE